MLKLITLNIELNKHFSKHIPFLKSEKPDVLCVQEIFKKDIEFLKKELSFEYCVFSEMYHVPYSQKENPISNPYEIADAIANGLTPQDTYELSLCGTAIFSRLPIVSNSVSYYIKQKSGLQIHNSRDRRNHESRSLLQIDILKDQKPYRILNTHFTWTEKGLPTDEQREDLKNMFSYLETYGEFILCGDFNAPRGGEIFSKIAEKYKDNIPPECTTTLDKHIHRAGDLQFVVDGIFTTPTYTVQNTHVVDGVSDHMAIVTEVL